MAPASLWQVPRCPTCVPVTKSRSVLSGDGQSSEKGKRKVWLGYSMSTGPQVCARSDTVPSLLGTGNLPWTWWKHQDEADAPAMVTNYISKRVKCPPSDSFSSFRIIVFFKNYLFIYLFIFETERQSMNGGGAERERETQNRKQAPGSEPSAQSPTRGSNSRTTRW